MKRGENALNQCRNSIGKSWGLPPSVIHRIYLVVVRPVITYACVVWRGALDKTFQPKILDKFQRIASLSATKVRKSFPQAALDTMLY